MRATRRESKREEKRTGSGSIRRASERDGTIERDRSKRRGRTALLRLGGKGMEVGEAGGELGVHAGAREREREKETRETKPSRIPRAQHWQPNEHM